MVRKRQDNCWAMLECIPNHQNKTIIMRFSNMSVGFSYLLATSPIASTQHDDHRHIKVSSGKYIANKVQSTTSNGNNKPNGNASGNDSDNGTNKPKCKLHGKKAGGSGEFKVNAKDANPAITSNRTILVNGGKGTKVSKGITMIVLVANSKVEADAVAIIAMDKQAGNLNGVVQQGGHKNKFYPEEGHGSKC